MKLSSFGNKAAERLIFNQHKVTIQHNSKCRFRQGRIGDSSLSKSSTGSWSLRMFQNVPHPLRVDPQGRLRLLSSSCCRWKCWENRSRDAGLRFHRAAGNKREGCNLPRSHLIPWQVSRLPLATGSRFLPHRLAGFTTELPNLLNSFSGHAGGAARERRRLEASRTRLQFRSPSLRTQASGGSLTSRNTEENQTGTGHGPPSPV